MTAKEEQEAGQGAESGLQTSGRAADLTLAERDGQVPLGPLGAGLLQAAVALGPDLRCQAVQEVHRCGVGKRAM